MWCLGLYWMCGLLLCCSCFLEGLKGGSRWCLILGGGGLEVAYWVWFVFGSGSGFWMWFWLCTGWVLFEVRRLCWLLTLFDRGIACYQTNHVLIQTLFYTSNRTCMAIRIYFVYLTNCSNLEVSIHLLLWGIRCCSNDAANLRTAAAPFINFLCKARIQQADQHNSMNRINSPSCSFRTRQRPDQTTPQ